MTMNVTAMVIDDEIVTNLNDLEVAVGTTSTTEIMIPIAAGHEVGQWTLLGQTTLTSAAILLAAALAVLEIDVAGSMIVIGTVALIDRTVLDVAELTRSK